MNKVTTATLLEMKKRREKIAALTAYDAPTARLLEESGVDVILVGDSVGNVKLGYENTIPVTMEEMLHHVKAVRRGVRRALLVADMPYLSYQISPAEAKANAGRLIKEGGAEAVKLEGGIEIGATLKALADLQVPVMGHLGLTPQSIHKIGGYKIQGRSPESADKMITDAKVLEGAGCFAIVLECVPEDLARTITAKVSMPTIGIGAGATCDGQILVVDDLLGLSPGPLPKFVRPYARLRDEAQEAIRRYCSDVKSGRSGPGEPVPPQSAPSEPEIKKRA